MEECLPERNFVAPKERVRSLPSDGETHSRPRNDGGNREVVYKRTRLGRDLFDIHAEDSLSVVSAEFGVHSKGERSRQ